jgi:hypothetical protein
VIIACTSRDGVSPRQYERASMRLPTTWDGAEINIHASYRFEVATRASEGCFAEGLLPTLFGSVNHWPITEPKPPRPVFLHVLTPWGGARVETHELHGLEGADWVSSGI